MLELKNVHVRYGSQNVLNGVNACFQKGKITSIIGANGCGKSTLLKAMLGIVPTLQGEILIDGLDTSTLKRKDLAQKIAYLAQGKNTPDMTVEQMVLHGRFPYLNYPRRYSEKDKEIAQNAMRKVGIIDFANKPLYTLSGGIRQTAYLAMALAQDTDYILLDEPTTYLDIAHQLSLMKILQKLALDGKGIISVMHDLPMAFDFSKEILLIHNGKTAIQDTPDALSVSSLIQEIFHAQVARLHEGNFIYRYV